MRVRASAVPLLFVASLLLSAAPVRANDTAAKLFARGQKKLNIGEMDRALALFRSAATRARDQKLLARTKFHVGVIHVIKGQQKQAHKAFRAALLADPDLRPDPFRFKPAVIKLYNSIRRSLVGVLYVTADMVGATVHLDGKSWGNTPLTTKLPVGTYQLEVWSADRKASHKQKVTVRLERMARVQAWLKRGNGQLSINTNPAGARVLIDGQPVGRTPVVEASAKVGTREVSVEMQGYTEQVHQVVVTAGAPARLDVTLVAIEAASPADPGEGQAPRRPRRRLWTWIAAGSAVAAAAAGIGLGASAMSDHEEYETLTAADGQRLDELEASMDDKILTANIMFGVAGALAVTSVVLFFVEGRSSTKKETARGATVAPVFGVTNGIAVTMDF